MVRSASGCAGKTVRSLENTCHTWALSSRRGTIQIHVCLTLTYLTESKHTAAAFLLQTSYVTSITGNIGIVVALKTLAKTTKLTTTRSPQFPQKITLALPGGALTTFPCNFGPKIFLSGLGVHIHPLQCTPGYAYDWKIATNDFRRHNTSRMLMVIHDITTKTIKHAWTARQYWPSSDKFHNWQILTDWLIE